MLPPQAGLKGCHIGRPFYYMRGQAEEVQLVQRSIYKRVEGTGEPSSSPSQEAYVAKTYTESPWTERIDRRKKKNGRRESIGITEEPFCPKREAPPAHTRRHACSTGWLREVQTGEMPLRSTAYSRQHAIQASQSFDIDSIKRHGKLCSMLAVILPSFTACSSLIGGRLLKLRRTEKPHGSLSLQRRERQ